jgi:bifunctional DNA-binding transcriptional regulator/antitoxin component of YhaV-PrlF toxin-antitoxin module
MRETRQELVGDITQVSKASKATPTLRTSIPLELAKGLDIKEGDSVVWVPDEHKGRKGLFVRKVE